VKSSTRFRPWLPPKSALPGSFPPEGDYPRCRLRSVNTGLVDGPPRRADQVRGVAPELLRVLRWTSQRGHPFIWTQDPVSACPHLGEAQTPGLARTFDSPVVSPLRSAIRSSPALAAVVVVLQRCRASLCSSIWTMVPPFVIARARLAGPASYPYSAHDSLVVVRKPAFTLTHPPSRRRSSIGHLAAAVPSGLPERPGDTMSEVLVRIATEILAAVMVALATLIVRRASWAPPEPPRDGTAS
jgi:hypothetical protein